MGSLKDKANIDSQTKGEQVRAEYEANRNEMHELFLRFEKRYPAPALDRVWCRQMFAQAVALRGFDEIMADLDAERGIWDEWGRLPRAMGPWLRAYLD